MKIIHIKGKDKATTLGGLYEEYGSNFEILSESENKTSGFFGLFSKSEYSAKVMIKQETKDNKNELDLLLKGLGEDVSNKATETKVVESKEVPMNDSALEMFMSLKNQMDGLQNFIKTSTQKDNEQSSELKMKLEKFLSKELISNEVTEEIISKLSNDPDLREVLSAIELFIREQSKAEKKELSKTLVFIGSTGVGKTTTIAKIASSLIMNSNKEVVLFTADTYRIAAVDQLNTYADILNVPVEVIYPEDNIKAKLRKWKDADHIFIDTAGRSHRNEEHVEDLKVLLESIPDKETFVVLNANMPFQDMKDIIDTYSGIEKELEFIITKTDETSCIGNILNVMHYTKKPIRYITHGQRVPSDFETFSTDKFISDLIGKVEI